MSKDQDLWIRANAIDLVELEILDGEILLRSFEREALASGYARATVVAVVALEGELWIEFFLHCHRLCSSSLHVDDETHQKFDEGEDVKKKKTKKESDRRGEERRRMWHFQKKTKKKIEEINYFYFYYIRANMFCRAWTNGTEPLG